MSPVEQWGIVTAVIVLLMEVVTSLPDPPEGAVLARVSRATSTVLGIVVGLYAVIQFWQATLNRVW